MEFRIRLPNVKVTKEELLRDLQRVSEIIRSNTIRRADYEKLGKYSYSSFRNHFGSWQNALEVAGLTRGRNWGSSEEQLLDNLKDVWIQLGRQPRYRDMVIPFSKFSCTAYAHKFGNWTQALIAFRDYIEEDGGAEASDVLSDVEGTSDHIGHKTSRNPNWRLRFKVMKRDNFRCVTCGRSPAKDLRVELHVDHIKPWSRGGETLIENLQTLCEVCNLGKSNTE